MKRVLHVLPHLGGGVGQVLGNITAASPSRSSFHHEFILLDEPGEESRRHIASYSLEVHPVSELFERAARADVVQLDWWNHPRLAAFLHAGGLPPCRLLVYSHVSGFHYPHLLTRAVLGYGDRFIASTEYALREHPLLRELRARGEGARLGAVHACSGLARVEGVRKRPHEGFRVGYVGALDFAKLHPEFAAMSAAADIPGARFSVYGQGDDRGALVESIRRTGAAERFRLCGYATDIGPVFADMDVLGYPLNPLHYGAGEQVLIESLGAGVPAVVLDNGPEKELIRDGYNGLVASSPEGYARCLERLAADPALLARLAANARDHARRAFSIQTALDRFDALYEEMLSQPRRARAPLSGGYAGAPEGLACLLDSLGERAGPYAESAFSADAGRALAADQQIARENVRYAGSSKGTVFHYRRYFPNDPTLAFWCGVIMLERREPGPARALLAEAATLGFPRARLREHERAAEELAERGSGREEYAPPASSSPAAPTGR